MKTNKEQRHIKLLQQAVINGDGGMELLIAMRERMQQQIDSLESRISETKDSNVNDFKDVWKLELELCLINARLFDGSTK
tara:strand:- start:177 stop:416 length:240 start_codon:yes stop_codon:yes gene_type:complete